MEGEKCLAVGVGSSNLAADLAVLELLSEAVDLELLGLDESALGEPVADLLTLVALELKNLSVLGVLHYGAIAGKLLENRRKTG